MARRLTLQFLKTDVAPGVAVTLAAAVALVAANSPARHAYEALLGRPVVARLGPIGATLPLSAWITHGLMAVVFFGIGLDLKLEIVRGELSSPRRLALPAVGALGGALGAALAYALCRSACGLAVGRGWAVPGATDGVLALAALALTPRATRAALRPFLLAVVAAGNALSVALIALLFTRTLDAEALAGAAGALCFLALLGRWRGAPRGLFVAGAAALWGLTLRSGLDPCVAGVAAAAMAPMRARRPGERGDVERTALALRPWTTCAALPVFVFCAAGAVTAQASVPWVLATGAALLIGKTAGMMAAWAAAVRLGWARRPTGASWRHLSGLALTCGGGLSLSLYVAVLAFPDPAAAEASSVKLGVMIASLAAVATGVLVLRGARTQRAPSTLFEGPPPPMLGRGSKARRQSR